MKLSSKLGSDLNPHAVAGSGSWAQKQLKSWRIVEGVGSRKVRCDEEADQGEEEDSGGIGRDGEDKKEAGTWY